MQPLRLAYALRRRGGVVMRSFATSTRRARSGAPPGAPYVINTADGRTAYVGTDSKEGLVNPLRFRNRAVVVTGGASGIGENAVREFVWEGANVALLDTDAARGRSLAKELNSADADAGAGNRERGGGGEVTFYETDVSRSEDLKRAITDFASHNGGFIHTLVNNAVYFGSKGIDATPADFQKSFSINLIPAAIGAQLVLPYMRAAGGYGCSIINSCSISSHLAQINRWTYASSKGALLQMTRTMALDMGADGIRVNSVSPAWIWTPVQFEAVKEGGKAAKLPVFGRFHMLRRVGEAHEVARAILFLASNDASFITGTDLPVDGGYMAMGPEGLGEHSTFADRNTAHSDG